MTYYHLKTIEVDICSNILVNDWWLSVHKTFLYNTERCARFLCDRGISVGDYSPLNNDACDCFTFVDVG